MKKTVLLFFICYSGISFLSAQDEFGFISKEEMKNQDFSFWIGRWEVFQTGTEELAGQSKIEAMLDGNSIKESYYSTKSPYKGTSINTYNAQSKQWEQFWVDNGGLVLHIKGGLEGKSMVLSDCESGLNPCNRISWPPQDNGTVRQVWDQSKDGGKTWSNAFDGTYVRKKED